MDRSDLVKESFVKKEVPDHVQIPVLTIVIEKK